MLPQSAASSGSASAGQQGFKQLDFFEAANQPALR